MVSDCGPECKESRTTYSLEAQRERDGVRLWTQMRREKDNVPARGGEGVGWCQIVDPDAKRVGQHTNLEVEREQDGVRLWTWMQREQEDALPGGGERA